MISQFGDSAKIIELTNHGVPFDVAVRVPLDADVRGVVKKEARFRAALAEHLAFWSQLGSASRLRMAQNSLFSCSKPNIQPEDKGPDGIFLRYGRRTRANVATLELHSVKNSLNDPRALVASARFRKKGVPQKGKALDDFFRLARSNVGFVRYDYLLSQVSNQIGMTADEDLRAGLIAECNYNVVVVGNHKHARNGVFDGFARLTQTPNRHVGTYLGADDWRRVAEFARKQVQVAFKTTGVW